MLLVDDRVGSAELAPPLRRLGLPVETCRLPFGDVAFAGRGVQGAPVDIGIELKTLPDLVGSLRSGRLPGYQLPGLQATYDHTWLIVEGRHSSDMQGRVTVPQHGRTVPLHGQVSIAELEKRLLTLEIQGGLHVRHTASRAQTIQTLVNLYRWWTDQSLDQHKSHIAVHQVASVRPISQFRQTVCQFPHVGLKASRQVEEHFGGSLRRAVNASAKEWSDIATSENGKRLGVKCAEAVVRFVQGR